MNGPQRENQNDHDKLCICKRFPNKNSTSTSNYLQQNASLSPINVNNLFTIGNGSTSQNTNSNNGMQMKSKQLNPQLPLIDLSIEENTTKDDMVIKDGQQETKNKNENYFLQFQKRTEYDDNREMEDKIDTEEIYEVKDLSMVTAKKKEVNDVGQVKDESVGNDISKLDKIIKYSAINKAAINRMINNSIKKTYEQNSGGVSNVNILTKNAPDNFKAKLLNGEIFNLLRRLQKEAAKRKSDQYTQTDINSNDNFSQTETQTKCNNCHIDSGMVNEQSNSYIKQNQLKYHMMVQDSTTQQVIHNNQRVFLQEGMNAGPVMMGREAVGNAEPAMMQGVLRYPYPSPVAFNANRHLRPGGARHPYVYERSNNRVRNPNDRNVHQPNPQPRSQHRPDTSYTSQSFDWEMGNNNNFQNYPDYQNPFSKF